MCVACADFADACLNDGTGMSREDMKFMNIVEEYRMTVHLFGAVSSPSCVNFAMRRRSEEHPYLDNEFFNNFRYQKF